MIKEEGSCTGGILSATRVLTAAHCVVDETTGVLRAASAFAIYAGFVAAHESTLQSRDVTMIRVHPGYVPGEKGDDVAELTTTEPFDLKGSAVAAIPLAPKGLPLEGLPTTMTGWGQTSPNNVDGHEHSLTATVRPEYYCLSGAPSVSCTLSPAGHGCPGDSGSPITTGDPPVLIGVEETGPEECGPPAEISNGFTEVTDPDIRLWLEGDESPPLAPRAASLAALGGDGNADGTATCASPTWQRAQTLSYIFLTTQGQLLQTGPFTYPLTPPLVGAQLGCVSVASNAGGTTTANSNGSELIGPPITPKLTLTLYHDGSVEAAGTEGDPTLRLTVTTANGKAVLSRTFLSDTIDAEQLLHHLRPGVYRVCVTAPPSGIFTEATTCESWTQSGSARELVHFRPARRTDAAPTVILRPAAALLGRRTVVRWKRAGCIRCRSTGRRIVFRGNTVLQTPSSLSGRTVELTIKIPAVTIHGVPFAAATVKRRVHG